MKIINKIKDIFRLSKKSLTEEKLDLSKFHSGQIIELEYVDPKSIGIINENTLTFTRLNQDEIDNRIIHGTIENIVWNDKLKTHLVYIKSFKQINGETVVRQYLFLEYEIKRMKLLS